MSSLRRAAAAAALSLALSGCGLLYTNVHGPRSYRTATPGEVKTSPADETASGKACNRSVLYLVAWGDGGYAAATKDAVKGRTDVVLYDVKSDMQAKAFLLGLYTEVCTLVNGKVAKL